MQTTTPHQPNLQQSLLERFNTWFRESVMIKLISIGFLIIILLLPSSWIQDLIYERQVRAAQVMTEVSGKWSGNQTVSGPILIIPYIRLETIDRGKDGIEIREHREKAYFLPEQLNIRGSVTPELLHRGIFDVAVYRSRLALNSTFQKPDFKKLNINPELVQWNEAQLAYGLTDHRGINENPVITSGQDTITAEPSNNIGVTVKSILNEETAEAYTASYPVVTESSNGIIAPLGWKSESDFISEANLVMELKGSRRLDFVPAGKTTVVNLGGSWKDPKFDGNFLPEDRQLTEAGFNATWKVLHFNRPFSQQWTNENQVLSGADFGVTLLVPVDQYQKSIRTSKYGILVILLTFMALFLVEITQGIRIHPFQYILIGAALIIYYSLLLSISEHTGYNIAYIISSAATVILISFYAKTFMSNNKLVLLFSALLTIFYGFIFVIILQQDFSLLIGSIGLFVIIGALMFVSRKVNWYKTA